MLNSHTEWGTLKEVILGRAENACIPAIKNKDIHCVDYADYDNIQDLPGGLYPDDIISETVEDLNTFQKQLEQLNIKVYRPESTDYQKFSTPDWQSDGYYNYCPRDSALIIGDKIIETPMPLRSRYFENFAYKKIFNEYFEKGATWISAPKGQLHDSLYDRSNLKNPTLRNTEPAFDAANILRCGKDLFYLVSNSGNIKGYTWLKRVLGDKYRVHLLEDIYAYVHLDTSFLPLSPGTVLINPERMHKSNIPEYFKNWRKIICPEPIATEFKEHYAPASKWLAMNVLSLSESCVVVEKRQTSLIRELEKNKFNVLQVSMRHCRTLSGGPHCVTLDTVRDDEYADYQ